MSEHLIKERGGINKERIDHSINSVGINCPCGKVNSENGTHMKVQC